MQSFPLSKVKRMTLEDLGPCCMVAVGEKRRLAKLRFDGRSVQSSSLRENDARRPCILWYGACLMKKSWEELRCNSQPVLSFPLEKG